MVSVEELEQQQKANEAADAINEVRELHGCKHCEHGEPEGVFALILYKDGHVHPLIAGDYELNEMLDAIDYLKCNIIGSALVDAIKG